MAIITPQTNRSQTNKLLFMAFSSEQSCCAGVKCKLSASSSSANYSKWHSSRI